MADTPDNARAVARSGARRRPRGAAERPRLAAFFALAAGVVALDQLTKTLVRARLGEGASWPWRGGLIQLTHVENTGAAFGILQGAGGFLLVTTAIAIAVGLAYLFLAPPGGRLFGGALAIILGGATGNLVDRVSRGTVTDFIDPTHYPAFNLADSSIVVGVCVLAWLSLREPAGRHGR